jgi:hypothetical protein
VWHLQTLVLALLVAEGVGVCVGAVVIVVTILRGLMQHRMAVFSVFLAIPNVALRTLANKSTNIGDEEEDSDDGKFGRRGWTGNERSVVLCLGCAWDRIVHAAAATAAIVSLGSASIRLNSISMLEPGAWSHVQLVCPACAALTPSAPLRGGQGGRGGGPVPQETAHRGSSPGSRG